MKKIFILVFLLAHKIILSQPSPFQKSFGDSLKTEFGISVIQLNSGSVFFAGYHYTSSGTTEITLHKLDMNGNIIWQQTYSDSLRNLFCNKMIFHNNTFYIAGQSTDQNSNIDALLLHIDTLGNLIWEKNYGSNITTESFNWVEPDLNFGFMCNGFATATSGSGNDIYIARLDSNGDLIWANNYGSTVNDVSMAIRRTNTGDFVLSGDKLVFPTTNYNVYVLKVDTSGNQLWDADLVSIYNSGCRSIMVNHNGDYFVVGESATPTSNYFDVLLCKVTQGGSVDWINTIPSSDKGDAGFSIMEAIPDHYLITGYGFNIADSSTDVVLIHADSAGNQISKRYYDHSQLDFGNEITPSVYGGFLIAGTNYDIDNQYFLIYDTISFITGIDENMLPANFFIYPNMLNESSSIINFSRELRNFSISVFDISGKELYKNYIKQAVKGYRFRNKFASGIYVLKIYSDEFIYTQKVIF